MLPRTIDYDFRRSSHGSTSSSVIYAGWSVPVFEPPSSTPWRNSQMSDPEGRQATKHQTSDIDNPLRRPTESAVESWHSRKC